MKDQTPTIQDTKAGTFGNLRKEAKKMEIIEEPKKEVNDVAETVSQFEASIVKAGSQGHSFIEVTDDVFDHYMKGQKTPYFYYHNIKVFREGTRDRIESLEKMTPEERIAAEYKK